MANEKIVKGDDMIGATEKISAHIAEIEKIMIKEKMSCYEEENEGSAFKALFFYKVPRQK